MTTTISRIGLIGYGNVGSHLSHILGSTSDIQLTVYNRSQITDDSPTSQVTFTHEMNKLSGSDLIIIAVNDEAIVPVTRELRESITGNPVVCHTAGSVSSEAIKPYFDHSAVLYPLQTFSKEKKLDYSEIPVFITASDPETADRIREVAGYISPHIHEINDDQRISLHIAAVFTCNYTNALFSIGHRICTDHNLEFKYLYPLIEETAQKIRELPPRQAQTGPAIRGDWEVIRKHENFLEHYDPTINNLYRQLADFINKNL